MVFSEKHRERSAQSRHSLVRARYTQPCWVGVARCSTFLAGQRTTSCRASYRNRLAGIRLAVTRSVARSEVLMERPWQLGGCTTRWLASRNVVRSVLVHGEPRAGHGPSGPGSEQLCHGTGYATLEGRSELVLGNVSLARAHWRRLDASSTTVGGGYGIGHKSRFRETVELGRVLPENPAHILGFHAFAHRLDDRSTIWEGAFVMGVIVAP